MSGPPKRPTNDRELKFTRQPSVRWFAPNVLADAGLRVLISSAFGAFLDKRELQKSVVAEPLVHGVSKADLWFDFIADTGDGFDATYTVAWLAAQDQLHLANFDRPLPRGDLVVLGGDEVYPVGNPTAYENKFWRPFEASLPWLDTGNPEVYAIPGNHDWYDGLTSFFRVFCQGGWIGGRRTRQTRSYFAIQLPNRWWIWGIDIQLDSYIDKPQQDYFAAVDLRPADKVILCTATPAWYDGPDSQGYRNLDFVERTLIAPRGAKVAVTLTGDSHHYAHYVGRRDGTHKVTAGGGGAFTHPTHPLGRRPLVLPLGTGAERQDFVQVAAYPDRATSRRMAWGAALLPVKNPTFMVLPAVVYVLLGWSSQFALRAFGQTGDLDDAARHFGWFDLLIGLVRNPVSVLIIVAFLAGLIGFAKPDAHWPKGAVWPARAVMGAVHLVLHLVSVVGVGLLGVRLAEAVFGAGFWFTALLLLLMGVLGGAVGGLVMGLYLAAACALLNAHGNETFSAMRLTTYKNFLRLHLTPDGTLTVYPIGIRAANTRWDLDPSATEPSASWLKPAGPPPAAHLIEPPFLIEPRPS